MASVRSEISTITAKGQTTIPKSVRQALGVDFGGKIAFRIDDGGVSVHRADAETEDPVLENFLAFLARDIQRRPEAIKALSTTLAARIASLTEGMVVDPAAEIEGEVTL
jgi:antitoxin PrlF